MRDLAAFLLVLIIFLAASATLSYSQEVLTNAKILEMNKAGVSEEIIVAKIESSNGNYDVSTNALIELKKAAVKDRIVAAMLKVSSQTDKQNLNIAEQTTAELIVKPNSNKSSAQLLRQAHNILLVKHSLYPALGDLESSVLKRAGWQKFNLAITRNRAEADLIVEINHEFLTHYNFRVVDAKTGKVLTASGVTSLGGALAGNVADKLIKRFEEVLVNDKK